MRLAVNTVVVIILGLVMVSTGIYFLQSIVGLQETVDAIGPRRRATILKNIPRGDTVYVHSNPASPENSVVRMPVAVRNTAATNVSPSFSVECTSCGGTSMDFTTTNRTIRPGDTGVLLGLLANDTWSPGQHTMLLNVTNQTGGSIGATTVIVQS
jgi:hypothetical protein